MTRNSQLIFFGFFKGKKYRILERSMEYYQPGIAGWLVKLKVLVFQLLPIQYITKQNSCNTEKIKMSGWPIENIKNYFTQIYKFYKSNDIYIIFTNFEKIVNN